MTNRKSRGGAEKHRPLPRPKPTRLGRPPSSSYPPILKLDGQTWLQAREAARRLGISRSRIAQLLSDGRLAGRMIHGTRYVREDDVLRYRALQTELTRLRAAMHAAARRPRRPATTRPASPRFR